MEEAPLFYGIATYACGNVLSGGIGKACAVVVLEQFQFETLCVSNHTACRFAEKRGFSAHFGPGGAVPPPRVSPFSKLKRSV